jgi:phosphoglycolate phosphatase-like HAD superfamily hydrolase
MPNSLLPSWNETSTKHAILTFVDRITRQGSKEYIEPEKRIAVFDNDGTLWCEKPLPIQADFFMCKLEGMAKQDRSLLEKQPWKAVAEHDHSWLSGVITKHYLGDDSDLKLMTGGLLNAFQGMTIEEFETEATAFLKTAQHPILKRSYLNCAYQPMIELLHLLKAAGFKNYIASGGGRDFMRPITQDLYEIPPECIIGSTVALEYRDTGSTAEIIHKPEADIFDDGPEKPVRIWSRIGQRPIFAAGNSNGDIQMLRFCAHPSRASMSLLVDHDDDEREFAYQTGAEKSFEVSRQHAWTVASIKSDWNIIFAAQNAKKEAA